MIVINAKFLIIVLIIVCNAIQKITVKNNLELIIMVNAFAKKVILMIIKIIFVKNAQFFGIWIKYEKKIFFFLFFSDICFMRKNDCKV